MLCCRWKNECLDKLAIGILKKRWLNDDQLEALIAELRQLRRERGAALGSLRDQTPEAAIEHGRRWIAEKPSLGSKLP